MRDNIDKVDDLSFLLAIANLKQKHLRCKKCKANQKQQLSTKKFDIKLRPRSLEYNDIMLTMAIAS